GSVLVIEVISNHRKSTAIIKINGLPHTVLKLPGFSIDLSRKIPVNAIIKGSFGKVIPEFPTKISIERGEQNAMSRKRFTSDKMNIQQTPRNAGSNKAK